MPTFDTISRKPDLPDRILYGISNRAAFPGLDSRLYLELLFRTSAHILQWREKDLSLEETRPLVQRGAALARDRGKLFLVNSRVELALEAAAGGAHLTSRQDLQAARRARDQARVPDFLLGKSVHSVEEARQAEREGADYVMLGPVFSPLSKAGSLPPLGVGSLSEAAQLLSIPVFAVGGIDSSRFPAIFATGARGIAGISWLREEVGKLLRVR